MSDANNQQLVTIENVLINGDLSQLSAVDRVTYYKMVCASVGINPLTRPFEYLRLNGKLVLYATKTCTDQLRAIHSISIKIVARERIGDVYVVTAQATKDERCDESTGAVSVASLDGEKLSNAYLKAETKAKRRVTLSLVGLGLLDESEVESIPNAERVDTETGEVMMQRRLTPLRTEMLYDTTAKSQTNSDDAFSFTKTLFQVKSAIKMNEEEEAMEFLLQIPAEHKSSIWKNLTPKEQAWINQMLDNAR